ncbi:MAG: diguanylate cyclase [Lentisphaerae bacterium]|nr:diguanylate cyclase [Lentisphaerota bacterium]
MKILIAEDDPYSRKMLESILSKWGYEVLSTGSGSEAWDILNSESAPQIAILDWMMPGMEGIEVCRKVRQRESGIGRYTYMILLTVKKDREDLIIGMESGADDYIFKPFDPRELDVRIRAGQRVIELQNRLRGAKEKHIVLSRTDSLTGVLNRKTLYEALEKELLRSAREKTPLSVIVLDIDFFKKINDSYGYNIGDTVLKKLAVRIQAELRPYDTFIRYVGDEFLILLPGAFMYELLSVAERIRKAIRNTPFVVTSSSLSLTASFGVAEFDFKENSDSLIKRADLALHKAKNNGRDRVEN